MGAALKVFVSAGTPGDEAQLAFRDAIVRAVDTAGLVPRLMTDRDWDNKNPLRAMRRVMSECAGAIVIAYTRYQFPSGVELRKDGARELAEIRFPTAWNQIEAAAAYERELPLLVVAQVGLREDAIFAGNHDIRPFWTALDPNVSRSDGFIGYLRSWREDVEAAAAKAAQKSDVTTPEVSVKQLFLSLPWYDAIGVVSAIVGLVVAALTIGYRVGSGQWPFS
jgi:hypothetical protein